MKSYHFEFQLQKYENTTLFTSNFINSMIVCIYTGN